MSYGTASFSDSLSRVDLLKRRRSKMPWIVSVPYEQDGKTEIQIIKTDVRDASNAIAQARQRNQGHGFDWDNAQVEEV